MGRLLARSPGILLVFVCWGLVTAGGAAAAPVGVFDLRTGFDARIDGPLEAGGNAHEVAAAGDVNGDGRQDLLMRTAQVIPTNFDRVYVVFGRDDPGDLDLRSFGPADGFVIEGTRTFNVPGSLGAAGDVNGDGLDDVIVGSPSGVTIRPGAAFVVFGKTSGDAVDVASLGPRGYRIAGSQSEDQVGLVVSGAGDVNGDGLGDVIVTGPDRRSAYVVFGKASTTTVSLASLGSGGFAFDPGDDFRDFVGSVAGLGDTNGDGLSDLLVGVPFQGTDANGRAFVVFGKTDPGLVDGDALGDGGYRIDNSSNHVSAQAGLAAGAAGDVNQDGLADMLLGAAGADNNVGGSGSVYVLFGKPDTLNLDLASFANGFRIDGKAVLDAAGTSVAGGQDLNGDARPDIVVGAPRSEIDGRTNGGAAYVVFGKSSPANVRLGGLNPGQLEIGGAQAEDRAGSSVAIADFRGDGTPDVVAGAPGNDAVRIDPGTAYIVSPRFLPRELTLSPESATNAVGDEHCVTAHAVDAAGRPATGFPVPFDVTGVNSVSSTEQTDPAGDATLCYEGGFSSGTDEIIAYADGNENGSRDPGEPGGLAAKEWIQPVSGPDCAVSFNGQIITAAGGRALLNGRAEVTSGAASGRHSYMDRDMRLRVKSRTIDALVCADDGTAASVFGTANGGVAYRIDLGREDVRTGTYRIRLDTGYDSGRRRVRGRILVRPS